ncbi:avidin/streptavidin family protein [Grimontia sp. SpTr1]|uniref:avidin/streptavidin family protein n=1 Tax=Grimontia sp. SpTr1 TaxID=2995319 RepID=UPI00248B67A2|nr:avidin/streptavidin family protein [Grimontia sp. SpTr1]
MHKQLTGIWHNDFQSKMELLAIENRIIGRYSSHTGSKGVYQLVGHCSGEAPTQTMGQSVALSIYWKNIAEGEKDESWHWAGSMVGQLQHDGKLTLTNVIVVSVPFGSYQKGNFVDKLIFNKSSADVDHESVKSDLPEECNIEKRPVIGKWVSLDQRQLLDIYHVKGASGSTSAWLVRGDSEVILTGFIDVDAEPEMAQSLSLSGYESDEQSAFSLSGMLEPGKDTMTLNSWHAEQTSSEDSFMQTRMESTTFRRLNIEK